MAIVSHATFVDTKIVDILCIVISQHNGRAYRLIDARLHNVVRYAQQMKPKLVCAKNRVDFFVSTLAACVRRRVERLQTHLCRLMKSSVFLKNSVELTDIRHEHCVILTVNDRTANLTQTVNNIISDECV